MIDDKLTFSDQVASFLHTHSTPPICLHMAMVISSISYCIDLLMSICCETGSDGQECGIVPCPKLAKVTPLLMELHWLLVDAHIKFRSLILTYEC